MIFGAGEAPDQLDDLLAELARRDRSKGRQHSDRWLAALIRIAVGSGPDAQLAARVIVQAMLPAAVRLTQSLLRPERDFDAVGQVVIASLYQVVRTYPASRQQRFAANLKLETLHRASRELQADAEAGRCHLGPELAALPGDHDVAEEASRLPYHPGPPRPVREPGLRLRRPRGTAGAPGGRGDRRTRRHRPGARHRRRGT